MSAEAGRLTVTLVKSVIGYPQDQRATVRSLGLHRLGHRVEVADNRVVRGMLHKVNHLVRVESAVTVEAPSRERPRRARPAAQATAPAEAHVAATAAAETEADATEMIPAPAAEAEPSAPVRRVRRQPQEEPQGEQT